MAALRERHTARNGMGYANRPGQHYAVSLDSQPRRICLSACRRCQSNSNTDRIANGYGYANPHCNGDIYADINTYGNGDVDSNTDTAANTYAEINANTQTSPDASAAPVSAASKVISDRFQKPESYPARSRTPVTASIWSQHSG